MPCGDDPHIFEEASTRIMGLAYRILGSRAPAEDAVQDKIIKRVDYVGAWLPEPIHMPVDDNAENTLALTSSLSTAFLLMLERLTPKERAAYLLHDIFEMSYGDVASTLDMEEAACRKLISRARTNIDQAKVRHVTPIERQKELLAAFEAAAFGGGTERLSALLSDDIRMTGDGGGKASVIGRVLHGKAD